MLFRQVSFNLDLWARLYAQLSYSCLWCRFLSLRSWVLIYNTVHRIHTKYICAQTEYVHQRIIRFLKLYSQMNAIINHDQLENVCIWMKLRSQPPAKILMSINVHCVPGKNTSSNRRKFERLVAAAAGNTVGAINDTISRIKQSDQTCW